MGFGYRRSWVGLMWTKMRRNLRRGCYGRMSIGFGLKKRRMTSVVYGYGKGLKID
jgi:hypothetical protein